MNGTSPFELCIGSTFVGTATVSGPGSGAFTGTGAKIDPAADISSGAITVIGNDGTAVTAATPPDSINFVEYDSVRGMFLSNIIKKGNVTSYNVQAYAAAVPQIQTVTLGTAPAIGDKFVLVLKIRSEKDIRLEPIQVEWTATAATVANVHTGLAANLAKHPRFAEYFATVVGGSTLVLTGRTNPVVSQTGIFQPSSTSFFVGLLEGWPGTSTNVTTQAPDPGHGNYLQVRSLEHEYKGYRGHLNNVQFGETYNYRSVSGTNYKVFTVEYFAEWPHQGENTTRKVKKLLQIFLTTGNAATFTTYFNALMAKMVI